MAKFIIRVESADEQLNERYSNGIECDGFCILTEEGNGKVCEAVESMSIDGIGRMIAESKHMIKAAVLGVAHKKLMELYKEEKTRNSFASMLGALKGEE